jgi:hypothetical protein
MAAKKVGLSFARRSFGWRALAFERYLKSGSGCAFAKWHLRAPAEKTRAGEKHKSQRHLRDDSAFVGSD